ncbi:hypothetical protein [Shewanella japonica]|uniref:hypothetical protein n=1 Tax=Shewanella japonica TaxID=93973 RepID=UPI000E757A9E|nr:hypothetical protein [Shewanella japonica]
MNTRIDYKLDDALNDLEVFFKAHIKRKSELEKFLSYLDESRKAKRISFRFIHQELISYRSKESDFFPFSDEERKMIEDLFYFWG